MLKKNNESKLNAAGRGSSNLSHFKETSDRAKGRCKNFVPTRVYTLQDSGLVITTC